MTAVKLTIADHVAEIRFNRPDRLNALDLDMTRGFEDAVATLLQDNSVRVVTLAGEGRAFVAGGDLDYLRKASDRPAAARDLIGPIHRGLKALSESRIPTIAALQGAVAGAGMSLALFTDLAVAADNVRFNMAYIKVAASPDCAGSWSLIRLVGRRKAAEIMLLADTIDAGEARRLGLVNTVASLADLDRTVADLASRIAQSAPGAMRRTRALLDSAGRATLAEQLDAELEAFAASTATEDFAEALDAFFGKRPPIFQGR